MQTKHKENCEHKNVLQEFTQLLKNLVLQTKVWAKGQAGIIQSLNSSRTAEANFSSDTFICISDDSESKSDVELK